MTLKKAELHVHLEGTISPQLAYKLAERNQLSIPPGLIAEDKQSYLSRDFLHFLQVYDTLAALIKTTQDYYDITFDYLKSNAAKGAIYIEMMYSPDHAEQTTGADSIDNLHAIQQAIDDAEAQFGIVGRIIITAVRHFGAEAATRVAKQAAKHTVPCAVGFGLGGDEIHFPPKLFAKAYQIAAEEAGLLCTVHAGEFAPASGMMEAMDYLPIRRIGHGVMAIHDQETIARVIDQDIALEICPSSNLMFGLFKDIHDHPFAKLYKAGVKVSINSDDPPFMSTNLANEYKFVQTSYGYSDEMMNHITKMALQCSFADEETKQSLIAKV